MTWRIKSPSKLNEVWGTVLVKEEISRQEVQPEWKSINKSIHGASEELSRAGVVHKDVNDQVLGIVLSGYDIICFL